MVDISFSKRLFVVTFKRPDLQKNSYKRRVIEGIEPEIAVVKTTDKTTDKATDKMFSDMEKTILDLIIANPRISQKEMAIKLGLTVDGIRYHTDKLKARDVLMRVGGKKTGHWEIVNK